MASLRAVAGGPGSGPKRTIERRIVLARFCAIPVHCLAFISSSIFYLVLFLQTFDLGGVGQAPAPLGVRRLSTKARRLAASDLAMLWGAVWYAESLDCFIR